MLLEQFTDNFITVFKIVIDFNFAEIDLLAN